MAADPLGYARSKLLLKELELEGKGYSPGVAQAAAKRAWKHAEEESSRVRPAIRAEAFADILDFYLARAEGWCARYRAGMSRP